MVAGGLLLMSYVTRDTPEISLMMRLDTRSSSSYGRCAQRAVMKSMVSTARSAPAAWSSWRRGQDYYAESVLIWLEVDSIIRQRSNKRYGLDDMVRRFHGGQSGPPSVSPFQFEDVVAALSELVPYDWKKFFGDRLSSTSPRAPMGGSARGRRA